MPRISLTNLSSSGRKAGQWISEGVSGTNIVQFTSCASDVSTTVPWIAGAMLHFEKSKILTAALLTAMRRLPPRLAQSPDRSRLQLPTSLPEHPLGLPHNTADCGTFRVVYSATDRISLLSPTYKNENISESAARARFSPKGLHVATPHETWCPDPGAQAKPIHDGAEDIE